MRPSGVGDVETILRKGVQDSAGVVKQFEGLVAGVGDGRGDLQVFQSVDLDFEGRGFDRQGGSSRDGGSKDDSCNEGGTERRGGLHCDKGSEGD